MAFVNDSEAAVDNSARLGPKKINGRALCKYPFSREKTLTTRGAGMDLATTEGLERGTRRLVPLSLSEPTSWLQIP